jgi:hypothetical protein
MSVVDSENSAESVDRCLLIMSEFDKLQKRAAQCGIALIVDNWFDMDDRVLFAYIQTENFEIRVDEFFRHFVQRARNKTLTASILQKAGTHFAFYLAREIRSNVELIGSSACDFFIDSVLGVLFFKLLEDACIIRRDTIVECFLISALICGNLTTLRSLSQVVTKRQLSDFTTTLFVQNLKNCYTSVKELAHYYRYGLVDFTTCVACYSFLDIDVRYFALFKVNPAWVCDNFSRQEWLKYESLLQCYENRSLIIPNDMREDYETLCRLKKSLISKRLIDICSALYWLPALLQLAIIDHDEPALTDLVRISTKYEMIATIKRATKAQQQ